MTLTVRLNLPNTAAPGAYAISLTVADSSGHPSHTLQLPLTVIQDFSVSPNIASQTVSAGQTTQPYHFTIAPNPPGTSFNAALALSCTGGLPVGAQCLFTPSSPLTLGSASVDLALSISTSASTSGGTYSVTVTGTSGSLSRSATVSLIVTNAVGSSKDFQLAATQAFPTGIAAGTQTQAKVSVTANYAGSFNIHCDASAISGQCLIAPINPVAISANAPVSLAVTLNVPNSITLGTYNIALAVADSAGQPSHTLLLPLTVIPDFSVSSATPSQTLSAGQTTSGPTNSRLRRTRKARRSLARLHSGIPRRRW